MIIPAVALCMALGVGVQSIYASENVQSSSLITKIAQKFNLSEDDVKAVFESNRQEHEQEKHQNYEAMLTEAVTQGKITEAQKQLIIAKNAEIKTVRDTTMDHHKDLTQEERQTQMTEHHAQMEKDRDALEAWAKENGIDMKYLMMGGGGHGPRGNF